MFDHILFPTDFSDISLKGLSFVKKLKDAGTTTVTVLHVIDERFLDGAAHFIDVIAVENKLMEIADEECNKIVLQLRENGLNVKFRVEKGIAFQKILEVAGEEDVSLIVIGSHGKSNVEEMLLGSVSEAVIRKAAQPVLLVKR